MFAIIHSENDKLIMLFARNEPLSSNSALQHTRHKEVINQATGLTVVIFQIRTRASEKLTAFWGIVPCTAVTFVCAPTMKGEF
jgi:hypothetical protein